MFAQIACATLMISPQAEIRPPKMAAMPFPLTAVRLLESPFRTAQEADRKYLLSLDPDRLLHRFRKFAGLNPKGDEYGGWEKDTRDAREECLGRTFNHAREPTVGCLGDAEAHVNDA